MRNTEVNDACRNETHRVGEYDMHIKLAGPCHRKIDNGSDYTNYHVSPQLGRAS
jgi:hypothetical protein